MTQLDSHMAQVEALAEEELQSENRDRTPFLNLIETLTHFAHHKRSLAVVTGAAMLVGVVYSVLLPPVYTATTKILTPQQTSSSTNLLISQLGNGGMASLAAATGGGLSMRNPNDKYIGLMNSRPVADAMIENFGLLSVYHAREMSDARKRLAQDTSIQSEKSGFISVSVTDTDKTRAAELANAYISELRDLSKALALTEASQRRLFYEEQLKNAKENLVSAEFAFQQVQQKKGLIQLDQQAKVLIENIAALQAQIAAKEVSLQGLRSYSTERNPAVQLAENELSSLRVQASQLQQRSHAAGTGDLGLQEVAGSGLEYLRAQHELLYRQALYDLLFKEYDAARLDEAKDSDIIQVVEQAVPPDRKSAPHRSSIVLLFAGIGFAVQCLFLILRDLVRRDRGISLSLKMLRQSIFSR